MTEAEKRRHRCCFTGHRPEKLRDSEQYIKSELKKQSVRRYPTDLPFSLVAWQGALIFGPLSFVLEMCEET
jgi:hypothetical protein